MSYTKEFFEWLIQKYGKTFHPEKIIFYFYSKDHDSEEEHITLEALDNVLVLTEHNKDDDDSLFDIVYPVFYEDITSLNFNITVEVQP